MALKLRLTFAEEFVPWLSQNWFFGMLKRDDGVQIHEKTHLYAHVILCRTSSVKAETSYWVSSEERVPSSSWFWLCWYLVNGFSLRSQTFSAICGLRADERIKIWGPRLLDRQPVTDQCPSCPPLISVLSFFFSVSGGFIPVGTEWFHPTDCP